MPWDGSLTSSDLPEDDVVTILVAQHGEIRRLLERLQKATGATRREQLENLRLALAVHEAAEEVVVRPVTGRLVGQSVADARNEEERRAERMLEELEEVCEDDDAFLSTLLTLRDEVLRHTENEETEEFAKLVEGTDAQQRAAMGRHVRLAESLAPTRPHPSVAGMGLSQRVSFPFAAVADRIRDALGR